MPIAITETKFAELKAKLRELFELDKSDLDFGIYRIMAAKNQDVARFLDRQLKDVVRQTLAAHGAGAIEQLQAELEEAVQQAQELGADPDALPKVKELRGKLAAAGDGAAAELEADIYNHLLAFFSRYYDEGDFISKRRYKDGTYAIPYNGEEVTLYWANKDQYYIKSGEWHKDYRFKVGGKSVRFKLIEATQETNNNKERDDAKRRYILDAENPIEPGDAELTLRFQFRAPTEAEKQAAAEATRIFGGSFDKPSGRSKGDEREQFCADAERRALADMPENWRKHLTAPAATEGKPGRTVLGKHLDYFTARNTFDYFIHKDLGGFLKRELDFYIKNEVVRLDDLEALPGDHLSRVQGKIKAIRIVAGRIIEFLASIENFQKKIWLKKKFVLETNHCITLDRVPEELYGEIAASSGQREEWVKLFAIDEVKAEKLGDVAYSSPLTVAFLKSQPHLVLDTKHFSGPFKQKLLACLSDFDEKLDGVLIHSENFQALGLMGERYRERIDCVYIDPPYNTGDDGFCYKDDYRSSSWLAMMADRTLAASALLAARGFAVAHIDEHEFHNLARVLRATFGARNVLEPVVWDKRNPKGDATGVAQQHEYIAWAVRDILSLKAPGSEMQRPKPNAEAILEEGRRFVAEAGGVNDAARAMFRSWVCGRGFSGGEAAYCEIDDNGEVFQPVSMAWPNKKQAPPEYFIPLIHPATRKPCPVPERGWRSPPETLRRLLDAGRIIFGDDETIQPRRKYLLRENMVENVPSLLYFGGSDDDLMKRFGFDFPNPKPVAVAQYLVRVGAGPGRGRVLDYFAGSGTTAHAVISLNREDGGSRKYILVEMGAYFHTVLLPRIKKVVYSTDWKDGKPTTRDTGVSHSLKYFALESYEDALNNLPAPTGNLLAHADPATKDAFITYSLDLELGPSLLNLDAFRDPWGYKINAQPAGEEEIRPHRVDLVETFNYLIGLKVNAYGPIERYAADFQQAEHAESLGRLKVKGRLRRSEDGPFVFQRVEGELPDGTRVLVVWRKLAPTTGPQSAEQDAAVLEAWMDRHREDTKQRSEHRDYHLIYINGPVTLPQPTAEIRTVLPIEQTFKDRMFEDEKGQ